MFTLRGALFCTAFARSTVPDAMNWQDKPSLLGIEERGVEHGAHLRSIPSHVADEPVWYGIQMMLLADPHPPLSQHRTV